jgi:hypothetical protein
VVFGVGVDLSSFMGTALIDSRQTLATAMSFKFKGDYQAMHAPAVSSALLLYAIRLNVMLLRLPEEGASGSEALCMSQNMHERPRAEASESRSGCLRLV